MKRQDAPKHVTCWNGGNIRDYMLKSTVLHSCRVSKVSVFNAPLQWKDMNALTKTMFQWPNLLIGFTLISLQHIMRCIIFPIHNYHKKSSTFEISYWILNWVGRMTYYIIAVCWFVLYNTIVQQIIKVCGIQSLWD